MILYDPRIKASLFEFGVLIPIHDSRTQRTFDALKSDPVLGPAYPKWHKDRIDVELGRRDLLRVHTPDYVDALYSDRLEQIITTTYELIDARGQYHRYDPGLEHQLQPQWF